MRSLALKVLVVEDEALLAMDLESTIEDAGHKVIAEAASLQDVARIPATLRPDLAFVDLQLAHGSSGLDVCGLIRARWTETFIVFVTANPSKLPDDLAGAHGVIAKPFSRNGLLSALRYIAEGMAAPPPSLPRPASFKAAPDLARTWPDTIHG